MKFINYGIPKGGRSSIIRFQTNLCSLFAISKEKLPPRKLFNNPYSQSAKMTNQKKLSLMSLIKTKKSNRII